MTETNKKIDDRNALLAGLVLTLLLIGIGFTPMILSKTKQDDYLYKVYIIETRDNKYVCDNKVDNYGRTVQAYSNCSQSIGVKHHPLLILDPRNITSEIKFYDLQEALKLVANEHKDN